jgi:hypothetical protein
LLLAKEPCKKDELTSIVLYIADYDSEARLRNIKNISTRSKAGQKVGIGCELFALG